MQTYFISILHFIAIAIFNDIWQVIQSHKSECGFKKYLTKFIHKYLQTILMLLLLIKVKQDKPLKIHVYHLFISFYVEVKHLSNKLNHFYFTFQSCVVKFLQELGITQSIKDDFVHEMWAYFLCVAYWRRYFNKEL